MRSSNLSTAKREMEASALRPGSDSAQMPFSTLLLCYRLDNGKAFASWNEDAQTHAQSLDFRLWPASGSKAYETVNKNYETVMKELDALADGEPRMRALEAAAKMSFSAGEYGKAKACAEELLALAPKYPNGMDYGNAISVGNITLGRLALRDGDTKAAVDHLLAAVGTRGSPQLNSFGPDFILANELLEKGQKDAVLSYLKLCANFWKTDRGLLALWTKDIQEGKPEVILSNL
jgi:tetratricopeptide (TPR) repeat protein